jgi:hypothetical protein
MVLYRDFLPIKKPEHCCPGFFYASGNDGLFDFAFVVDHMLAHDGIVFFDRHFVWHVLFVFVGGVEVAGAGAGNQTNFVTHGSCSCPGWLGLYFFAAGADVAQHLLDAHFVDDAHAFAGQAQRYETVFRGHPKAMGVQVGQKPALGAVFRVGYVVTDLRTFAGNHTNSGHGLAS